MTASDVRGCGRQRGYKEQYRGGEGVIRLLSKVKLEIAVNDEFVKPAVEAIMARPIPATSAMGRSSSCRWRSAIGSELARKAPSPSGPDSRRAAAAALVRPRQALLNGPHHHHEKSGPLHVLGLHRGHFDCCRCRGVSLPLRCLYCPLMGPFPTVPCGGSASTQCGSRDTKTDSQHKAGRHLIWHRPRSCSDQ